MPHLTTPRLLLRDLAPNDVSALHAIESDSIAVRYQSYVPRTLAECGAYIASDLARRTPERSCFDLAVSLSGQVVGRVGLDIKLPERSVGELWFILARAHWGQGLMPEAARALVAFGFTEHALHRVFLECDPRNLGAIRLAEKLGMRREGDLRQHAFIKGEWCDSTFFGLLASDCAIA
jgi:[ribosomal protein S5]-alanine N-acetyltransferase